jgi:hypothetical protein
MLYALAARWLTHAWVAGWASIFVAVLFIGGVQLICLGVIGEYVGRIYGEAKKRPLYFTVERLGFSEQWDVAPRVRSRISEVATASPGATQS